MFRLCFPTHTCTQVVMPAPVPAQLRPTGDTSCLPAHLGLRHDGWAGGLGGLVARGGRVERMQVGQQSHQVTLLHL